ncbi:MAG: hypothetical protein AAB731_04370 [Patescibacteria group bacterium]
MNSRFLKLSLANFGYKYSKKSSKSFGSALIYVGASFLLLAIILAVFNFVAQTSAINSKTAERPERTIVAGDYLS